MRQQEEKLFPLGREEAGRPLELCAGARHRADPTRAFVQHSPGAPGAPHPNTRSRRPNTHRTAQSVAQSTALVGCPGKGHTTELSRTRWIESFMIQLLPYRCLSHIPLAEIRAHQGGQHRDNSLKDRKKGSVKSRSPELQKHTSWAPEPLQLSSQGLQQILGFQRCAGGQQSSASRPQPCTPLPSCWQNARTAHYVLREHLSTL